MIKRKIAILRGGPSSEHIVSLNTGRSVLDELCDDYHTTDVTIDKSGNWYVSGVCKEPGDILRQVDLVFNAMHGEYGEDGKVQQLLENLQIPFTGPKAFSAALSMDKAKTKEVYITHKLNTPLHKVLHKPDTEDKVAGIEVQAMLIFKTFLMPVVIKPVCGGSSVGVSIARDYKSLVETLISVYIDNDKIIAEEYIEGKEATVAVIDQFRGKEYYSLLPVEIRTPKEKSFFDYEAKYTGITEEICPGSFTKEESIQLQEAAIIAHKILGLRHYSRTDFIVHPRRGIYLLETNSLPGLTKESLLPKSLDATGIKYKEFLDHVISLV